MLLFLLTPLTDGVCPIVDKFSDVGSKKREEYWQQTTDGKKLTLTQHKWVLVLVLVLVRERKNTNSVTEKNFRRVKNIQMYLA